MLRQDQGVDKTNVIARAPKVILSAAESTVKLQVRGGGVPRSERNWEKKANLNVRAKSKCGIRGVGDGKSSQSRTCAEHRYYNRDISMVDSRLALDG
jgi:hypothetical protein